MTSEDNKALARRFLQAWSAGGQRVVDELAQPDIVVDYTSWPEPVHGAEGFKAILTQTFAYFPDMQIEAQELVAEADRVVVRWRYTASHQYGELFGRPASGRRVQVAGMTVYRLAGGKVVEERGIVDSFSLWQQITAEASPAGDAGG